MNRMWPWVLEQLHTAGKCTLHDKRYQEDKWKGRGQGEIKHFHPHPGAAGELGREGRIQSAYHLLGDVFLDSF